MSVSRWKVMACTLGLSLGGLAICAGQPNDRLNAPVSPAPARPQATEPPPIVIPEPARPSAPTTAPETLPPLQIPSPPAREIELEVPSIIVPVQVSKPLPIVEAPAGVGKSNVPSEKLPMPRETEGVAVPVVEAPPAISPPVPPVDNLLPPIPPATPKVAIEKPSDFALPPVLESPPQKNPTPVESPMVRDRVLPDNITTPPMNPLPPVATPPAIDFRPAPQPQPQVPVVAAATTKLKMLMRLGDGKPRFEIRTSDSVELLLKVYGEKIEMQSAPEGGKASPIAGVTAVGKVRFTGPGIEGTCDQLTVLSGTGEVLLKGNVHVKTKRGKSWSEMTTEKMIYQIGAQGLSAPAPSATPVRTTSFEEAPRFSY